MDIPDIWPPPPYFWFRFPLGKQSMTEHLWRPTTLYGYCEAIDETHFRDG